MWRFVSILAVAFWLGGLTFYALVAVPVGTEILGSVGQGFITQRVTHWLNLIAVGLLAMLLVNVLKQRGRLLIASWLVMLIAQAILFAMHPWLDAMLDGATQSISDPELFYSRSRHGLYLDVTGVQWGALIAHLWCVQVAAKTRSGEGRWGGGIRFLIGRQVPRRA